MDVKTLYTLVAIADRGSFAEAAKALNVSLSAVSIQMRLLEEELDTRLFDRSRRPPVLTESGLLLTQRARELIEHWESLSESLRREAIGSILRLGAVHTAVSGIVPPALARLQKQHQNVEIRLTTGLTHELETAVLRGELDAAVVTEPEIPRPELEFHLVIEEPLVVIAHAHMKGRSDRELLEKNPYVCFNRIARVGRMVQTELTRRNISIETTMEIDSLEGVIAMVANGLGVSVVPARGLSNEFPSSIRTLSFGKPPIIRRTGLLWMRAGPRLEPARMVLQALLDTVHAAENEADGASGQPGEQ